MYDRNMPSNKTTPKTNLIKLRQLLEKVLGEVHVSTYHSVKTKQGMAHVDQQFIILTLDSD
jgi:hypothetical protein